MPQDTELTPLVLAWSDGKKAAAAPLMDAVYDELRRLARGYLMKERREHSLPATALVHEPYLKLVDQRRVPLAEPSAFLRGSRPGDAPPLVDHAWARGATKRGAGLTIPLDGVDGPADGRTTDLLALDTALDKLAALDPRQAGLVELRYFGGLTVDEAATVLDVAPITVKRDWAMARTWLYRELGGTS